MKIYILAKKLDRRAVLPVAIRHGALLTLWASCAMACGDNGAATVENSSLVDTNPGLDVAVGADSLPVTDTVTGEFDVTDVEEIDVLQPDGGPPGDASIDITTDTGLDIDMDTGQPDLGVDLIAGAEVPRDESWYVQSGQIFNRGTAVRIRGVNWFGLETADAAPHGLWSGVGLGDIAARIASMGFNAVRLPVGPKSIQPGHPTADWAQATGLMTGREALLATLATMKALDIAVLLDFHSCDPSVGIDQASGPGACDGYSIADWHSDLQSLASVAKFYPNVMGIDLFNEPHGLTWTDWATLAGSAAAAVLETNPHILIIVEGVGNESDNAGVPVFWGENLVEAQTVSTGVPASRLVFSPHVYGPSVSPMPYFESDEFPNNLSTIWDAHFGYLVGGSVPLVIGEFGGRYDERLVPGSVSWMDAFVSYAVERGLLDFFYWSINPNSGDTGGLLLDDWSTVDPNRMAAIAPLMVVPSP